MALWTDLAVWRGPTPNRTPRGMNRYDGQVTHIAAGYYQGTIAWQLNDSSNVSSHFVVGRERGECAQMVDTVDAAWTQGEGNGEWISIENAGFLRGSTHYKPGWEWLTPWQIECNAQLYARGHKEFGWPLRLTSHPTVKGLGYHSMGAENGYRWGHIACPGEAIKSQLPEILTRAIQIVTGVGGGADMFLLQVKGDGTVWLVDGHKARALKDWPTIEFYEKTIGLKRHEAPSIEAFWRIAGEPWIPTEDLIAKVEVAAEQGAQGGSSGATAAEVRTEVRTAIAESFQGGAVAVTE